MERKVNVDDLVVAHEIASRLVVARPQIIRERRWRQKEFPKPIAALKTALIWDWQEVATSATTTHLNEKHIN